MRQVAEVVGDAARERMETLATPYTRPYATARSWVWCSATAPGRASSSRCEPPARGIRALEAIQIPDLDIGADQGRLGAPWVPVGGLSALATTRVNLVRPVCIAAVPPRGAPRCREHYALLPTQRRLDK